MAVALILLLVAVASVLFHLLSPWWWTPLASNWGYIDDTITLTFWITGAVFSAVVVFMAYCVFRFRHTEGNRAAYNPENKKLEWWLSVGTDIGVAAMLAPGLVVWHQFVTFPADATEIGVMGRLCCKSPKTLCGKISAKRQNKRQSSIGVASNAPPKSSVSSSQNEVVPHINIRLPHPWPGKSVFGETKRVLQHNRPDSDIPQLLGRLFGVKRTRYARACYF